MALLEGGGYAELVAVRARQAVRVPDNIDLIEAGGIPEVFITAYDALFARGRLQHGETVLIHGGGGGVGTAAVQLARQHGCRVLVTAGSDAKLARCVELGADAGINYADDDLKEALRRETGGAGPDVIYDPVGGSATESALRAIAWGGRFLVVGFAAGEIPKLPLNLVLLKSCDVRGVFWGAWTERDPAGFHSCKYVLELALRHRERVVLETRGTPGSKLQLTVRPCRKDSERAVHAFEGKTHHLGVERDTGIQIVDLEDDVIERCH